MSGSNYCRLVAISFVRDNFSECSSELLEFRTTGNLSCSGKIYELCLMLKKANFRGEPLELVETTVINLSLLHCSNCLKKSATPDDKSDKGKNNDVRRCD